MIDRNCFLALVIAATLTACGSSSNNDDDLSQAPDNDDDQTSTPAPETTPPENSDPVTGETGDSPLDDPENVPAQATISADTYAPIAAQAFRLVRDIFGPDKFSAFDLFPFYADVPALDSLTAGLPVSDIDVSGVCETSGSVSVSGDYFSPDFNYTYTFTDCATSGGVANGTFGRDVRGLGSPNGGNTDTYDLSLTSFDIGEGPGSVTLQGVWNNDSNAFPEVQYTIERIVIDDSAGTLEGSGNGTWTRDLDNSDEYTGKFSVQGTALGVSESVLLDIVDTIRFEDDRSGGLVITAGTLLLTAADGSAARLSASDTPGIATVELLDADGAVIATDSRDWNDFL